MVKFLLALALLTTPVVADVKANKAKNQRVFDQFSDGIRYRSRNQSRTEQHPLVHMLDLEKASNYKRSPEDLQGKLDRRDRNAYRIRIKNQVSNRTPCSDC